MFKRTMLTMLVAGLALTACARGPTRPTTSVATTAKGQALADAKGMTLYTFDKDSGGKSACNGQCAVNWPPLFATSSFGIGDWSVVARDDGSKQWAYKGKPLYTFIKDTKPGDVVGDGFNNNVWHIAAP